MLFNTPLFFWFFALFFLLYNFVFVERRKHLWLLVISSLIFYGSWNYAFLPLLVGNAVMDYLIAAQIQKCADRPALKKRWLVLGVTVNLSVLALFKYSNFVLQSVADLLAVAGVQASLPVLSIILPVGISFYTFQSMSYTIDVYRGDMKAHRGFLEYMAAVSFFPQLLAGPILRASHILPQLDAMPVPTWGNVRQGLVLVVAGLLKKSVADLLAGPAAAAFDASHPVSSLEAWTGALAFTAQIYGDFSGYTDIAIGIALIIGFHIPRNFNLPYFSVSPVDFWRRWHISLSSWLRDYLYISLGGNRNGHRTRNVFITMLLGGLWHGAAWTFVLWGAWHGLIITITHALADTRAGRWLEAHGNAFTTALKWLVTLYLVVIGWVFFRATSFGNAFTLLAEMHLPSGLPAPAPGSGWVLALVVAGLAAMHAMDWALIRFGEVLEKRLGGLWQDLVAWPALALGFVLVFLIGESGHAFIYFQF